MGKGIKKFFYSRLDRYKLASLGISRINFAFLDAQHTKEDVLKEFKFVSKRQLNGDIVVFDDVTYDSFQEFVKR